MAEIAAHTENDNAVLLCELIRSVEAVRAPSIEYLAHDLSIGEATLTKLIDDLISIGYPVVRTPTGLLRQEFSQSGLNEQHIRQHVDAQIRVQTSRRLAHLLYFPVCESTQSEVEKLRLQDNEVSVVMTDYQTCGRGRQGRRWNTVFGSGICFSLGMSVTNTKVYGGALSLVVALALAHEIEQCCDVDVMIKWPNDLILLDRKLAGILLTSKTQNNHEQMIYVGIGINIDDPQVPKQMLSAQAITPIGLNTQMRVPLNRTELVAKMIGRVLEFADTYFEQGFQAFHDAWKDKDYLLHEFIHVYEGDVISLGKAKGVAQDGALLVDVDGRERALYSGDVRVRQF